MAENLVDITSEVEYVYLTIPARYVCLYHKLLVYLSDFGLDLLKDCKAGCSAKNKSIIDCWNMFQALCAAYTLGEEKKAKLLYDYITAQLELYYKQSASDSEVYEGKFVGRISEDGFLKAIVTCRKDDIGTFEIDAETGELWRTYIAEKENNDVDLNDEIEPETP